MILERRAIRVALLDDGAIRLGISPGNIACFSGDIA
jgi:hypothetical protein